MVRSFPILIAACAALVFSSSAPARDLDPGARRRGAYSSAHRAQEPVRLQTRIGKASEAPIRVAPAAPVQPTGPSHVAAAGGGSAGPALPGGPVIQGNPTTGLPVFTQLNGFSAHVPMDHESCGGDCWNFGLVDENGNTAIKGKIQMTCPAGEKVSSLYYVLDNQVSQQFVNSPQYTSMWFNVTIHPFQANDFLLAGQNAFGGSWNGSSDDHPNASPNAQEHMKDTLTMIGTCTGGSTQVKEYTAWTKAAFVDTDF